jgi:hypothetical protein
MDPLSIAASIAGLLSLTGAILSKGYAALNRAKKNGSDIEAMLSELASFSGVLFSLKAQFDETEQTSNPLQWLAEDHTKMWQEKLEDCDKTLKELVAVVTSLATTNVVKLMVKGDTLNSNIDKLVLKIERFKSFFILCLQLQAKYEIAKYPDSNSCTKPKI